MSIPTRTTLNIRQPISMYQVRQVQQAHQTQANPRPVAYTVVHTQREEVQFPDIPHEQLVEAYKVKMTGGGQCHPHLKSIYDGFAIFQSQFDFQFNAKTKIAYDITCRVPLTDALLQKEHPVNVLYCTESIPFLTFRPVGWRDKNGMGMMNPDY